MWRTCKQLLGMLLPTVFRVPSNIPRFDPKAWGHLDDVQYNNNCYNYACDVKGAYAQPGRATGNVFLSYDCAEVSRAVIADGLIPVECDQNCDRTCHQVALVIWPEKGFHCYRRDRNGFWSHKWGDMPPTNLDNGGNLITDPRSANRGPYTVFCGCYCVCKDRVSIL